MKRYGLIRTAKDVWEHPSGLMWCIPLAGINGEPTWRERGLWEVVEMGKYGPEINRSCPENLKACAAWIHANAPNKKEPPER